MVTSSYSAPPRLLATKEVAAILGVKPSRVHELVRDGQLRSVRFGAEGWHRFDPRELERFIAGEGRDAP